MSADAAPSNGDPNKIGRAGSASQARGHGEGGPASKRVIVGYGFWIFLLSDIVMFSGLFAAYAVLAPETAGGPGPRQLFDLRNVQIETACLLLSSFACGLATIAAEREHMLRAQAWLLVTGLLGTAFLGLELREFATMVGQGAGPGRSAFLSAFFTLVGCHGAHVTVGLLWLGTMMAQLWAKGFKPQIMRRMLCFGLFWHALDIIWVALFTVVYILGMRQ
ncbi:cytochrome o ubiquinol oxidase subunit III [Sphingomonas bacterium]|uniref:cytochrome o ubiquinol oxidase subunit III n=1 Tax=Sphingomonas bacterium TaxID=1895847 RepID=UPI0015766342|nr:cytochrome o ubiquinol oxidase subunit III [Sphingomonas bacterium]